MAVGMRNLGTLKLDVVTEGIKKARKKIGNLTGKLRGFATRSQGSMKKASSSFREMGRRAEVAGKKTSAGLEKGEQGAKSFRAQLFAASQTITALDEKTGQLTTEMTNFNMSLLGVMFAGMQHAMVMSSLLRPVKQAFGIGELFSSMLLVVMLPAFSAIFPYILDFVMWMMNLSEGTKTAIGAITIILFVLGKLLFFLGAAGLGIIAMVKAWGTLTSVMSVVAKLVPALKLGILGIVGVIAVLVSSFLYFFYVVQAIFASKIPKEVKNLIVLILAVVGGAIAIIASTPAIVAAAIGAALAAIVGFIIHNKEMVMSAVDYIVSYYVSNFRDLLDSLGKIFGAIVGLIKDPLNPLEEMKTLFFEIIDAAKQLFDLIPGMGMLKGTIGLAADKLGLGRMFNDFVMSDGQIHPINPNDKIVGFKGDSPMTGGSGGGTRVDTVNINIDGDNIDEREVADRVERRLDTKFNGRL